MPNKKDSTTIRISLSTKDLIVSRMKVRETYEQTIIRVFSESQK
jgi:hypothetical protein